MVERLVVVTGPEADEAEPSFDERDARGIAALADVPESAFPERARRAILPVSLLRAREILDEGRYIVGLSGAGDDRGAAIDEIERGSEIRGGFARGVPRQRRSTRGVQVSRRFRRELGGCRRSG